MKCETHRDNCSFSLFRKLKKWLLEHILNLLIARSEGHCLGVFYLFSSFLSEMWTSPPHLISPIEKATSWTNLESLNCQVWRAVSLLQCLQQVPRSGRQVCWMLCLVWEDTEMCLMPFKHLISRFSSSPPFLNSYFTYRVSMFQNLQFKLFFRGNRETVCRAEAHLKVMTTFDFDFDFLCNVHINTLQHINFTSRWWQLLNLDFANFVSIC